ncbi:MAG: DEAD/DEAH box helicase, partial [Verrucomicrobia bacterium]|nr:DEAD/DEAH box helicase [Verrucomicrobiota bacterium]
MQYPDFLEPWRSAGRPLSKRIGDVLFSGPTYQIEIKDTLQSFWVFLQLSDDYSVKDIFCSCDESTERGSCAHMAAAYLFVAEGDIPLHVRFESSYWNRLFLAVHEKCGARKPAFKEVGDGFECLCEGASLFKAVATKKGMGRLSLLLAPKAEETEETSIKFSNLTDEELERWRQGRPSQQLRYELSPLSDLAKWLFLEVTKGQFYQLSLVEENAVIDVTEFSLTIPDAPSLKPVGAASPPTAIQFDPKAGKFQFTADEKLQNVADVSQFLDSFSSFLEIPIHTDPVVPTYHLYVDPEKRLHIDACLFEKGDLSSKNAHVWGRWAYLPARGLERIEELKFPSVNHIVTPEELSEFLTSHRYWLSLFPGFSVHTTKMQEEIVYEVESGALVFRSVRQKSHETKEQIDFDEWTYVVGDGFYVKLTRADVHALPLDKPIARHMVADFIRRHLETLKSTPRFFTSECPIKEIGLSIQLRRKGEIEILPEYEWFSEEDKKGAIFYDEFIFVRHKGFYRLPPTLRPLHFTRTITADDPQVWSAFFLEQLPRLKEEYSCTVDKRLEKADALALHVAPIEQAQEQKQGKEALSDYLLDIFWRTDKGKIQAHDLLTAKKNQERFLPTDAGLIDLTDERFHWLETLKERREKRKSKTSKQPSWRLFPADFLRVQAYDTIHVETSAVIKETFTQMLEKLLVQVPFDPPNLETFNCTLRPYQRHGVDWLWFLYQNSLSGLLCDDMGVGKTHQAMGLMDAIYNHRKNEGKRSLFIIVCPTSLVYHWEDKVSHFLPKLRVNAYVGTDRCLEGDDFDVVLTTYGILRNESAQIRRLCFDAAFFDELQIAKNHVSQVHGALLQVQAHMKVGLTGTPIENQLRELKALFDIVLPGYMPQDSDFREFFVRPIEKMENPGRRVLLSRFVRPFILRRRKADVLPDLPEKIEEIYFTELVGEQKHLYRNVAGSQATPLIQQLRDESLPIPYMHIFALLSSLKQICNHPAAYLKDAENYECYESGKWESFVELLEEAQESEQKVVVFSQYLTMLDIMELHLKKKKIGYAQIRGQTKNRADEVGRFQKDPACMVFLGSLQAAGLGIDLTAASIVIHYDRWWNPARENQATDRV